MINNDIERLRQIKLELNEIMERCDKAGKIEIADLLEVAQTNIRRSIIKMNK